MARRRQSGLDLLAALPWPVGIVLGIIAFVVIRHGAGWYLSSFGGPLLQGMGQQVSGGAWTPLAWMMLALCWLGAAASYLRRRQRRRLLETQTGLNSLTAMSWREFEMLVGEAFRRRGYAVEETGLGGPDGGIDLTLRKDGRKELVQCKQWRKSQVSVTVVREMWGLAAHHQADGIKIVCVGNFTPDAAEFASGKPIELISGSRLSELVREVQTTRPDSAAGEPTPGEGTSEQSAPRPCPICAASMVLRRNRSNGQTFLGCSNYPRCRGTMAMENAR